jgi:hypothetical protein
MATKSVSTAALPSVNNSIGEVVQSSVKVLKEACATNVSNVDRSQYKYPNGKTIGVFECVRATQ